MQVHPTSSSVQLAAAGLVVIVLGVALEIGPLVAWGGAIVVALAVARAVTEVSIARVRVSGLEMLWLSAQRSRRIARGELVEVRAELRNRDPWAVRYRGLRPVASPELEIRIGSDQGELPAGGRLAVTLEVRGLRVGRHALHGLALEVLAGPGLFEVPLTFSSPFGFEVMPSAYARFARLSRGGRGRRDADRGPPSPFAGESSELRELRQHQPGDPFRRIAWKASARRGELLVREYEREERDVVFVLLDAAVELGAGEPGSAVLDRAVDGAATVAMRHLGLGDRVGLGVLGRRVLGWLPPARGAAHGVRLLEMLANAANPLDADRSGLDEADVALRVLEHLRPFDPSAAGDLRSHEIERIARRAERVRARAPFPEAEAFASTARERALRGYLAAFGMGSPARIGPDRPDVDELIARSFARLKRERPRPSLVYVWSPAPEPDARRRLLEAVSRFRSRRTALIWASVPPGAGLEIVPGDAGIAARVLVRRAELARGLSERELQRVGARVEHLTIAAAASGGPLDGIGSP